MTMHRFRRIVITALAVLINSGCAKASPDVERVEQRTSGKSGHNEECAQILVLEENGLGALRIGRTVTEVGAYCHIIRDSVELDAEAMPVRVIHVALPADTIIAEVVNDRVWRIVVTSPGLVTADSIHVGVPAQSIVHQRGARGVSGDGRLFVRLPQHCGLSFQIDMPGQALLETWDAKHLQALPNQARVESILIVGCQPDLDDPGA